MRRRDDAHVDLHRLAGADALERHLLKHAQQLGLHVETDVADLVEKQRAAVGRLEAAHLVADGVGERPLDVAKQFAFQQRRRQGGAMDLDERLAGAGLLSWTALASSSLPVPLSPRSSTADGLAATLRTSVINCRTGGLEPMILPSTSWDEGDGWDGIAISVFWVRVFVN